MSEEENNKNEEQKKSEEVTTSGEVTTSEDVKTTEEGDASKEVKTSEEVATSEAGEDSPKVELTREEKIAKAQAVVAARKAAKAAKEAGAEGEVDSGDGEKPAPVKKAPAAKRPPKKPAGYVENLVVSSSPHFLVKDSVPKIMHNVILALFPATLASVYFFGMDAFLVILVCVGSAMGTEYGLQKINKQKIRVSDGSAIITGLLLALTLPPTFPLFGAAVGGIVSIGLGKYVFGGLGFNIFNPALLGRAFLQAAYPVQITTWVDPFEKFSGISAATPLGLMKFEGQSTDYMGLFWGNASGSLGETSAILLLLGGLYLRYKGYVNWKMPLCFLGSIALFSGLFWMSNPEKYGDPLFHVLAGGAMLGAWFMVTDMVTSPVTVKGQIIFAVLAGFITVLIRLFSGLQEGVMYAILFSNSLVPLLNTWTRPTVFGEDLMDKEVK